MVKHRSAIWLGAATLIGAMTIGAYGQSVATLASPASGQNSSFAETSMGDLAADAVRAAGGTDAAVVPAGSLTETGLPAGEITPAQIARALTYPRDPVVLVRLTGRQLDQAFERSWSIYPRHHQGLLQVSGITYSVDRTRSEGDRVSDIRIGNTAVAPAQNYTLAMPESIGDGGLGYFKVWDKTAIVKSIKTTLSDALAKYLTGKSQFAPPTPNRVHVVH